VPISISGNGWNNPSGMAHNMYIGHAARFILRNSTTRATKKGGHLLKSRAVETRIEGCTLASLAGDTSREMDIPEGGIVHIQGSVLEKGPGSENPETIGYLAEEYDPSRTHSFTMLDSVLVNDQNKVLSAARAPGYHRVQLSPCPVALASG
jgi:hypothetical protein